MRRLHVVVLALVVAVMGLAAFTFAATAREDNNRNVSARLNGFHEAAVAGAGAISTTGTGVFTAKIDESGQTITYTLTFTVDTDTDPATGSPPTATVAHIHFAERHVGGGVIAFLCGGGGKPACPASGGTVTGIITAANIIGPTGQGIGAGQFAEAVRAIRAGAVYANVHSTRWPSGEIRGQVGGGRNNDGDNEDDD